MRFLFGATNGPLEPFTRLLLRRMLCPLSGLAQEIGFAKRAPLEPRVTIAGGDMAGVHILRGVAPPPAGAYHIGGSGITYEEAVIRTLGETIERYAQFTATSSGRSIILNASLDEMRSQGRLVRTAPGLRFFSDAQLTRPGFPFSAVGAETTIGWAAATSVSDGSACWAPAQQAVVGYVRGPEEPPFMSGVTTGTAAHRRLEHAARNALLELIQIDAATGHWYGSSPAFRITSGSRIRLVDRLIRRRLHPDGPTPHFYWLPSPDLPGLAVACLLESGQLPHAAVGLGCDLRLSRAVYKAFLEAAAVAQLAKVILFRQVVDGSGTPGEIDADGIYDLDSNVAHYARRGRGALGAKFNGVSSVEPSELPADIDNGGAGDLKVLTEAFQRTGKELLFLDLTTRDVKDLGFCVVRLWSPDLLNLPLPSAPPVMLPRFAAYGGVAHEAPHPYP